MVCIKNNVVSIKNVYSLLDNEAYKEKIAEDILKMNEKTDKYNLVLTKEAAIELVETRSSSLKDNGLIEFDASIINKIIDGFYSSSNISTIDYEETLNMLIERFYDYRLEYNGFLNDELIIEVMRYQFDKYDSVPMLSDREINIIKYNRSKKNSWDYGIDDPFKGVNNEE